MIGGLGLTAPVRGAWRASEGHRSCCTTHGRAVQQHVPRTPHLQQVTAAVQVEVAEVVGPHAVGSVLRKSGHSANA